jgi:hypothetical protein
MNKKSSLPTVVFIVCLSISLFSLAGSYFASQGVLPEVFQQAPGYPGGGSPGGGESPAGGSPAESPVGSPPGSGGLTNDEYNDCWWICHKCDVGCHDCDQSHCNWCRHFGGGTYLNSSLPFAYKQPKDELQILGVALAQDQPAPSSWAQDEWCCGGGGGGGGGGDHSPPPQGSYRCEDLGPIPNNPQPGQILTFTCTSGASNVTINHYNFRVNNGTATKVTTSASTANFNFTVPADGGSFTVQCQVCKSSDDSNCTQWGQMQ